MIITLVGMSGTGKTYWSKKLAKKGFIRYCCDDLIEKKLSPQLQKLGFRGINDVAKWMGQPYDAQYTKTSQAYLNSEIAIMQELLSNIQKNANKNIVIDTSGSVIYTGKVVLTQLAKLSSIMYLETPISVQEEMLRLYLADPKPVIWGNIFDKKQHETNTQALARCYPLLLSYRTKKYKKLANLTLDYHTLRKIPAYATI